MVFFWHSATNATDTDWRSPRFRIKKVHHFFPHPLTLSNVLTSLQQSHATHSTTQPPAKTLCTVCTVCTVCTESQRAKCQRPEAKKISRWHMPNAKRDIKKNCWYKRCLPTPSHVVKRKSYYKDKRLGRRPTVQSWTANRPSDNAPRIQQWHGWVWLASFQRAI